MMDDVFIMDKELMSEVIKAIKSLKVNVDSFDEADKWVGIIMLLETAMNPPKPVKEQEKIKITNPTEGE